jgi:hypothetical protein
MSITWLFLQKSNIRWLPLQTSPVHIDYVPQQLEDIGKEDSSLLARLLLENSQRRVFPNLFMNRIVYDSMERSKRPIERLRVELTESSPYDILNQMILVPGNANLFSKSEPPCQYYLPANENDKTLVFESRFENGNLRRAIQVYSNEYDLIINFDLNTLGHTQWFYFAVKNMQKGVRYKFNIVNLLKSDSLYNQGMKPLIYSDHDARTQGKGWVRGGENICYYRNSIKRKNGHFYTFSWSYIFENANDTYYFAYCYPYTYSDLQNYLNTLEAQRQMKTFLKRSILCQTNCGNNCDLLTITSEKPEPARKRKGIIITGRVHPGESNSSWMMKGVIDFLTESSAEAKLLRDNFVFKIVPMLNPDGVIVGNYRCSILGDDLNRKWAQPSKKCHPTIWYTKQMIKEMAQERDTFLFCDLHGHSRKRNMFIYGCADKDNRENRIACRIFPRVLCRISESFSFEDCNFAIQKSKESTARVVLFKEFGLINSYTLESSFMGSNFGINNNKHFNTGHFEQMGHFFCKAILDCSSADNIQVKMALEELKFLYANDNVDSPGSDEEPFDSEKEQKKKKKKKKDASKKRKAITTQPTSNSEAKIVNKKKHQCSAKEKSKVSDSKKAVKLKHKKISQTKVQKKLSTAESTTYSPAKKKKKKTIKTRNKQKSNLVCREIDINSGSLTDDGCYKRNQKFKHPSIQYCTDDEFEYQRTNINRYNNRLIRSNSEYHSSQAFPTLNELKEHKISKLGGNMLVQGEKWIGFKNAVENAN